MERESPAELRVWLEPAYDHGRTGAWLLDWPGAFTWGADRAAALARVPSAAHRFVDWLAGHGDTDAVTPPLVEPTVIEEVAAVVIDGGYEVNATFAADARAVDAEEVETTIRRLGYAREDLLTLVRRLRQFESAGGRLALEQRSADALASGADPGREGQEVLRHVAGAEAWFVSRLDGSARYGGPARDGDLDGYLAATRDFLVEGLRSLARRDGRLGRTDGKGESWTLAKVLRRALYHSLDHLNELDRRLALAERRVERLEIRHNARLDAGDLRRLFAATGLNRRARDGDELTERMLAGSTETIAAFEGDRLVGFARIISDEATNGYISTVAVAPDWQDRRLGTRLMRELMHGREELKLTLDSRDGVTAFYQRLGFEPAATVMVRPRGGRQ